jgi:GNAT superfamily N-acetyltransferase
MPATTPTIRSWRPTDPVLDHIAGIYREFAVSFDAGFESDLLDVRKSYEKGSFWVAELDGELVGTVGVAPDGPARVIKRIYVAARARRIGLARTLLRTAAAWGRYPRTELWSDVRFRGAHRLYLSEGFRPGPVRVLTDPDKSVERYFWRIEPEGTC